MNPARTPGRGLQSIKSDDRNGGPFSGGCNLCAPLLLAIDRQNNGIQVELQLRPRLRQCEQLGPQLIVQANYLAYRRGRQAYEEAAQCGLIRESFQSDQRQKQSVVMENLGFIHALKAGNQDVEQRHDHVLGSVINPAGRGLETALEATAQTQLVTKPLNQEQPAEVGQRVSVERIIQCLQAS